MERGHYGIADCVADIVDAEQRVGTVDLVRTAQIPVVARMLMQEVLSRKPVALDCRDTHRFSVGVVPAGLASVPPVVGAQADQEDRSSGAQLAVVPIS